MLKNLSHLSDESLVNELKNLRARENHALAEIILYLSELDSRKYYRDLGYSSLFTYCTAALGYSESAAYRRIQAARILRTNPEIYSKVRNGEISLSAIAEVSKVKEEAPRNELLKQAEGKSKKEVELLTVKYQPQVRPKKETIKPKRLLSPSEPSLFTSNPEPEAYTITIEVDKEFMELLNEAKELGGHKPASEVFRSTLKEYISRRKTIKRSVSSRPSTKKSRFIPKSVKVAVRERDNHQCSFVSQDGVRCTERHGLQFDHKVPYSAGGSSDFNNLRLLCRAHNMLMAERVFGKERMEGYVTDRRV